MECETQSLVLLEDECRLQEARGLDCNQQKIRRMRDVDRPEDFFWKGWTREPVDHDMKCIFQLRWTFRILFDATKSVANGQHLEDGLLISLGQTLKEKNK